jgi:hypothetical protein
VLSEWKVLHQQEIIGSFLEVEDNKKQVSVIVSAWHTSSRDRELEQIDQAKQHPWLLVGSVFFTQVLRFGAFILGYEDKMYPFQPRFRFNSDYVPCSVSSRLEASRFHRILLHTIVKSLPDSEFALQKATQSSTNIPGNFYFFQMKHTK